jgi:hypothetical protein
MSTRRLEYEGINAPSRASISSTFPHIDVAQSRSSTMPTASMPPTISQASALATSSQIAADLIQLTRSGQNVPSAAAFSRQTSLPPRPNIVSKASSTQPSSRTPVTYLSEVEAAILRSNVPINVNETEEITVLGQRGIWANKAEVANWKGVIPISQYAINEDGTPQVITKRTEQKITYIQVSLKLLFSFEYSSQMKFNNSKTYEFIWEFKFSKIRFFKDLFNSFYPLDFASF